MTAFTAQKGNGKVTSQSENVWTKKIDAVVPRRPFQRSWEIKQAAQGRSEERGESPTLFSDPMWGEGWKKRVERKQAESGPLFRVLDRNSKKTPNKTETVVRRSRRRRRGKGKGQKKREINPFRKKRMNS